MTSPNGGPDPIGADMCAEHAARRLPARAVCVVCGKSDPTVLRGRSVIEAHHIAGAANDEHLRAPLCLNCHRKITNDQRAVGVALDLDPQRTVLERLVALLRGLAVFFEQLAGSLIEWAHRLEALIAELDSKDPTWRDLPHAS